MIRNVLKPFRLALAVGVGIPLLVAASAYAQDPAPPPAGGEAVAERVIVTGSYIPTAETESALPVTVYTAEVLQKQGANTPVEGLRQLPSFVGNSTTENDSNAGNGSAGINLRGIGQDNTLILINGRRAYLGAGLNVSPDINAISIGALSRTEVLKDGASSVYGADAVAGVVNFIMLNGPGEKPYEGAELFALYGNTTDTDAHVRQVYLRGGVTGLDGKVSIAAAGEYYSRANLFSRDREIATNGNLSNFGGGLGLSGSNANSQTFGGRVSVAGGGGFPLSGQLVLRNLSQGGSITPGDYRRFTLGRDPSQFNFRAYTPAIPSQEEAKYFVTGRYKIFGEGLQIYGDVMYSKLKQDNGLAGSPFAVGGQDSPYNPFGDFLNNVRYRTVNELGLRRSFFDHDYYRYVVGINGDFNFKDNAFISRFGYDSGFVYERFDEQRIDSGDAQFTPLAAEISAGNFNPFIGTGAPLSGTAATYTIDPETGLPVPTGGTQSYDNTAAAQRAAYLGHSFFYERDYLYDIKLNAHLFPNLWNGGIDFAIGYSHANTHLHSVPDPVQAAGDQLGFNQAPNTKTTQEVNAVFMELGVPLVTSTMNVPFVRSLEFSVAWRYEKFDDRDDYTKQKGSFENINEDENFGGSPRLSIRYQPIADLTLRASWGQSFKSPTPSALFDPVSQNFPLVFDALNPGGGATTQPTFGVWQGGNVNLQPEKTDSYSAGVVWTPKFVPGFTMTADWYQLFTTDLILSAVDNAQILLTNNVIDPDGCGNGFVGDPDCQGGTADGVTRDTDGSLKAIDADSGNAGKRLVQGLDVTATYEIPTDHFGKFTLSGGWNHFFTWKAQPGLGEYHNFLGDFSQAFPLTPGSIPFNKAFLRGEWEWHNFDFVITGNYIGDYEDDPAFIQFPDGSNNTLIPGTPGTGDLPPSNNPQYILHRRVAEYITMDLQLSYEFKKPPMVEAVAAGYSKDAKDAKSAPPVAGDDNGTIWQRMLWNTKLTAGVNNAFDRQPPSLLGNFNDGYDTSLYSIRNRYWYVSLSKKF
jgi:iron complex outermembrane receptor protein